MKYAISANRTSVEHAYARSLSRFGVYFVEFDRQDDHKDTCLDGIDAGAGRGPRINE